MTAEAGTLEAAAAAILGTAGFLDPVVTVTGAASTGAVRATLFIDIEAGDHTIAAVAQVSSAEFVGARMDIEDEAALITLAAAAGLPVAAVLAASNFAPELGAPLLIARRVGGITIPRRVLRLVEAREGAGDELAGQCGLALANLHRVDAEQVPDGVNRLERDDPAGDYVDTLTNWLDELAKPNPVLRYGINWLRAHRPSAPPTPALVHGDFRNGNLIITESGLVAVLDWELAHVGDPMEDLAYLCLRTWRFGNDDKPVGGFGSLAALRTAYTGAGGVWREDAFAWWMIARTIWWGIGLAQQAASFEAGATRSIVHAASGRRVVELEYDALTLIGEHTTT